VKVHDGYIVMATVSTGGIGKGTFSRTGKKLHVFQAKKGGIGDFLARTKAGCSGLLLPVTKSGRSQPTVSGNLRGLPDLLRNDSQGCFCPQK